MTQNYTTIFFSHQPHRQNNWLRKLKNIIIKTCQDELNALQSEEGLLQLKSSYDTLVTMAKSALKETENPTGNIKNLADGTYTFEMLLADTKHDAEFQLQNVNNIIANNDEGIHFFPEFGAYSIIDGKIYRMHMEAQEKPFFQDIEYTNIFKIPSDTQIIIKNKQHLMDIINTYNSSENYIHKISDDVIEKLNNFWDLYPDSFIVIN